MNAIEALRRLQEQYAEQTEVLLDKLDQAKDELGEKYLMAHPVYPVRRRVFDPDQSRY